MGMKELATEELAAFGYTLTESDDALLSLSVSKAVMYAQNEIADDEIPAKLIPFIVDMICGEFLSVKKAFSPESIAGLDLSAAVKRIQAGDTSTEFAVDKTQTAEGRLDAVITGLKSAGKRQFSCFRRLRS
jgi:hypothetical protein